MACISFAIDFGIDKCVTSRRLLYEYVGSNPAAKYFAWILLPILLIQFATGFVHVLAPQAIGSGIPEIKTILRGVVLKEYLTIRTLVAKMVGLTATLGSGMPLGKEGPFVHIASIVATLMSSLVTRFQGIYSNESRKSEMLAAAAAVGVACCFAAPIGGVLFSIECTTVFFAVRNYWRGFFAAVCGAVMFRLLAIWTNRADTVVAMFRTAFKVEYPYDPLELFVFAGIGAVCGVGGALYVNIHRRYVLWMRGNKRLSRFLQKNRFIYPTFIAFLLATATFPLGLGQFHAGILGTHDQVDELFSNVTWMDRGPNLPPEHHHIREHWESPFSSIFANLGIYMIYTYFGSILASTLPVPTGVVIPSFKTGAAFGRLVGEAMAIWFPHGISYGEMKHFIVPGGYATAGAAAFTGAVTHTISISVIVFEMTGQITHIIPVLIAVLVSNAIAHLLGPSCFDSIILIKKLPYLPDILPSRSTAYNVFVEDFMLKEVKYIWHNMTFYELKEQLVTNKNLRSFPLVDSPNQMILLGSIQRTELISMIQNQISNQRRLAAARKRFEIQRRNLLIERQRVLEEKRLLEEEQIRKEAERLAREELAKKLHNDSGAEPLNKQRRPSRFEVTTVETFIGPADQLEKEKDSQPEQLTIQFKESGDLVPRLMDHPITYTPKSILKKGDSYTSNTIPRSFPLSSQNSQGNFDPNPIDGALFYQTITGVEHQQPHWRNKLQSLFKKPSQMTLTGGRMEARSASFGPGGIFPTAPDMSVDEIGQWEEEQMKEVVNFSKCQIDPAPFQLVEKTSLLKVHNLFSMVGVTHAYVTAIGKLVGVVGLAELRAGIENANGTKVASNPPPPPVSLPSTEPPDERISEELQSLLNRAKNTDLKNEESKQA
jgi:chloride channel 2